ncbi:MAG: CoA transferase [Gammaproteobacteria bacterium]|nr:CoA transferase [Gammaproteobacteria bacterium]
MENNRIFEGLKVWDMSWVGVGPLTARYLADNGATVVRLDSTSHPDILRTAPPFKDGVPGFNRSMFYGDYNCSKLGLGLNMKKPEAHDIAFEMAQWADVIIESFTPGTMANWGLSYEALSENNPRLIMLSTCMQGQTGPRASYPGFGNLMASMSGFYEITGWPDRDPVMVYGAYTDFIAQRFTTMSVVAALDHCHRTGEGQFIDVAQFEASLQFLGPEFLDFEVNQQAVTRSGNADSKMAPHGVYPCQGEDQWIAIAVKDNQEWAALKSLMGSPAWAADPRFDSFQGRNESESVINDHISQWTSSQSSEAIFKLLQPAVSAGLVHDCEHLYTDDQIVHRNYFVDIEHPVMGTVPYNGAQTAFSESDNQPTKASPCIGEDSHYVLKEFLNFDDPKIEEMLKSDVVQICV